MVGELPAQPFRADRLGVRSEIRLHFGAPFPHNLLRPAHPFRPLQRLQKVVQPGHRRLGIALQSHPGRIAAPQLRGVNVNLNNRRPRQRDAPIQRNLAPGMAADKQGQIGLGHHLIGAPAGIGAANSDGKGMIFRDGALGVQGSGDGDVEHFGQAHHFGLSAGGDNAAAGHYHRPAGGGQNLGRFPDFIRPRLRAQGSPPLEILLDDDFQIGLAVFHYLALDAHKVQMYRAGRAGSGFPKGLPQQMRQLFHRVHRHAVFGGGTEGAEMLDFLVGVAVLVGQGPVAGDGDDRGKAQKGVLQAGGEVGRADRLGHADRRAVGGAGVAVGHISRRLFAVGHHPLHTDHFHFGQDAAGNGGNIKDMGQAVPVQGFGYKAGAGHSGHSATSRYSSVTVRCGFWGKG